MTQLKNKLPIRFKGSIWLLLTFPILLGLFLLFSWLFSSCNRNPAISPTVNSNLITAPPNSTPTATPFQPDMDPMEAGGNDSDTATSQPQFATWGDFPAPQVFPVYIQIPPPVPSISQPPGQITILLMGSDQRPNDVGFRTDTMILATINPQGKVSLTSFPRDLFVYIPGWMMNRLNTAQGYGGFATMQLTFEYNFGVRPDYYVLINFNGFRSVVNSLGGITVNAGQTLTDSRTGYPDGFIVYPGLVEMDGETALWYVRSRSTSSDIDRLRRAQEVLQAIGLELFSLNALSRIPELFNTYRSSVDTNLTLESSLKLLPALNLVSDPSGVQRFVISYDQAYDWIDPGTGAQVLLPVNEEIQVILNQALNMQ